MESTGPETTLTDLKGRSIDQLEELYREKDPVELGVGL